VYEDTNTADDLCSKKYLKNICCCQSIYMYHYRYSILIIIACYIVAHFYYN